MKKYTNILFTVASLLAFASLANAQYGPTSYMTVIKDPDTSLPAADRLLDFPLDNGLQGNTDFAYSKNISAPFTDGTYWIKLESYSTGAASRIEAAVPADIVLVLDLSSSMMASRGTVTRIGKALSYNDVVNARTAETNYLYAAANSNNYYQLFGEVYNGRYYIYVNQSGSNNRNYIRVQGTTISTTNNRNQATSSATADGTIATFPATGNNSRLGLGSSRIFALKDAVDAFIDEINKNDKDNAPDGQDRLGDRLSVVTFTDAAVAEQDLIALTEANVASLKEKVWNFSLRTGTRTSLGITEANNQLNGKVEPSRSRTVIVFTDGEPYLNQQRNYTLGVPVAYQTKTTYDATVYTIGMFGSSVDPDVFNYMNYVSSNYPDAEAWDNPGDPGEEQKYFYNVSDPNYDLSSVFTEIAQQSGGTKTSLSAASSNVDVVSSSFVLPEGIDTDNIDEYVKIFIAKVDDAKTKQADGVLDFNEGYDYQTGTLPDDWTYRKLDEDGEIIEGEDPIKADYGVSVSLVAGKENAIKVTGFDYSSCFCGPIYEKNWNPKEHDDETNLEHVDHYQGYKIIIMIPIKVNEDAIGGPNVDTNAPGSGIYINDGDTDAYVAYNSPTVSLPYNIYIQKFGLEPGESAKFKLEKGTIPTKPEDAGDDWTWTVSQINDWTYVSTVFVTKPMGGPAPAQETEANAPVIKVRGLPSTTKTAGSDDGDDYIYRITEESWAWSYNLDSSRYTDKSKVDNPFKFYNTKKNDIEKKLRHAESKADNIFNNTATKVYNDSKNNTSSTGGNRYQ